jgi:hypothetical protein
MPFTDSELAYRFHKRARRALLAGLSALNALPKGKSQPLAKLSVELVHQALSVAVLRFVVLALGRARGLFVDAADLAGSRLFAAEHPLLDVQPLLLEGRLEWAFPAALRPAGGAFESELVVGLQSDGVDFAECPAELVGNLYELLLGEGVQRSEQGRFELATGARRKQTGTFFTPRALTEVVVARALEPLQRRIRDSAHRSHDFVLDFRICDPTVGGGAFLVQAARALLEQPGSQSTTARRRSIATRVMYGVDINPIAVAVAEAALCLFVCDPKLPLAAAGSNLRVGDALLGAPHGSHKEPFKTKPRASEFDFLRQFPEIFERGGFDLVIGNPPWVAYAGRAAKPLPPERKAYFAAHYTTLKGYPTLHGLFVERALRLAPQGTVALVVPSPIADLQGYRAVRRAVRASHTPSEPMLEFGQDAFESVTQPCFALIAEARTGSAESQASGDLPFRLAERQRAGALAAELKPPEVLAEISRLAPFPAALFGEMGFQTTSRVSKELLLRAAQADARHHYPLLEGRDVRAFWQGDPHLFLAPDQDVLAATRCRLRERDDYGRVRFVIRQTARYPIAALHRGLPFRNSLLAGFTVEGLPPELVVGLLNSSLYRALHLATQRDARQATFPQVKISHLRALPAPPDDAPGRLSIAALSRELSQSGVEPALAERLDAAVFELFAVENAAAREIREFLDARCAPRA